MTKRCPKCQQVLPSERFYACKWHKDGLSGTCRKCKNRLTVMRLGDKRETANKEKYERARTEGKVCRVCNRLLPMGRFYPMKKSADKLSYECKDCVREQHRKYRNTERGRLKVRASNRRSVQKLKDTFPDKYHEQYALAAHRYRARQRGSNPDLTKDQWQEVLKRYNFSCVYCGESPKKLTMDHVVSLFHGGKHTQDNVVPACGPCNFRKGPRPLNIFAIQK